MTTLSNRCWCGGERGPRIPADADGLGCMEDVNHAADPLADLRALAVRLDLPMPEPLDDVSAGKQWPAASWGQEWFFPDEEPSLRVWGEGGWRLDRHSYNGPVEALGSILTVPGGTGHLVIEELVADFLVTRLVHDPLLRADTKAWQASGKPMVGEEWSAIVERNSWDVILAAKENWNTWFAELVAHIAHAVGLVEIDYSIYSSRLTDRAKAWARLILLDDFGWRETGDWRAEYAALLAMNTEETRKAAELGAPVVGPDQFAALLRGEILW